MDYRPQANSTAERMVQTLTRAIKMYDADVEQKHWNDYDDRLNFVINTSKDRVGVDTSFYLIHVWDPRSTLEGKIPLGSNKTRNRDYRRWHNTFSVGTSELERR